MSDLLSVAPCEGVTQYDRVQLPLYAALLDAEAAGWKWQEIAVGVMGLDPEQRGTEECVRTHMERAHWLVGAGLEGAIEKFAHLLE